MATKRATNKEAGRASQKAGATKAAEAATVIQAFTGLKEGNRVFMVGDEFTGPPERVSELRAGGYLAGE